MGKFLYLQRKKVLSDQMNAKNHVNKWKNQCEKRKRKTGLHGPLMKQSDTKEKDLTGPAPTRVGGPKCKTKEKKT